MSTILKALRRLAEDGPGESPSDAATSEAGASPTIPATDELRDRILAEERANEVTTAPDARRSEASTEADAISANSPAAVLRIWAPLAAFAIAILVLGVVVVPAVLESGSGSEPSSAVATGRSAEQAERGESIPPQPESPTTVAAATPASDEAASPTAAPVPAPPRASPPAPKSGSSPNTLVAAALSTPPATSVSPLTGANRATKSTGPVAVADLPIASVPPNAPAPTVQPSPSLASSPARQPTSPSTRAVPVEPAPTPVELALVEPANAPPESSATAPPRVERKPAPPGAVLRTNPAPPAPRKPAAKPIERAPIKPSRATPEPERPTSSAGPVAKTADAAPIERIARPDVPDVTIVRTAWHPSSDRRSAKVRLEATDEVLTLREGDAIGALVVKEISPSAVLFETGGVELRRRVGSGR